MKKFINKDLNKKYYEILSYINEIKNITNNKEFVLLNFFYENLNILDNKSQSLLQFNSIILAILTFWIDRHKNYNLVLIVYYLSFIFFLISSLLCLKISFLKWTNLEELKNTNLSLYNLVKLRNKRTKKYRLALILSLLSVMIICINKIIDLILNKILWFW